MSADVQAIPLRRSVVLIGAASGMSSGVALVAAIVTDRPLWLASTFIFVPGLIALVAVSVWVRRHQQALFLSRVRAGIVAGLLGTAAYDLGRFIVERTHIVETRSFVAIRAFGAGLTGRPLDHSASLVAGWAFHLCNGVGFALAYTMVAAGRRWFWGIPFALGLETAMILLYPGWLGINLSNEFLSVSILAHVAYGAVLGRIASVTT